MSYYTDSCKKFYQISCSHLKNKKSKRRNLIRLGNDNENRIYLDTTPNHIVYNNNPFSIQYKYNNCTTVSPVGW